jgi:hypothetical protein
MTTTTTLSTVVAWVIVVCWVVVVGAAAIGELMALLADAKCS